MGLQHRLPLLPEDVEMVSPHLAAGHHDGVLTFFNASGPIFTCREADASAVRVAAAVLTSPELGLATPSEIARVLGRNRNTSASSTASAIARAVQPRWTSHAAALADRARSRAPGLRGPRRISTRAPRIARWPSEWGCLNSQFARHSRIIAWYALTRVPSPTPRPRAAHVRGLAVDRALAHRRPRTSTAFPFQPA